MTELDRRIAAIENGSRPDWASTSDIWFAWHPVRLGALGTGPIAFGREVWRNRFCSVTIYQELDIVPPEEIVRLRAL